MTLSLRYQLANERARALYASMGFQETEARVDGEVVARLACADLSESIGEVATSC